MNEYAWSASRATLAGTPETAALEEMVNALTDSGIVVEMWHSEGAPGQVCLYFVADMRR